MAAASMSKFLQHLRRTLHPRDEADPTDGQLLECFISRRDEAAFAVLVRRHGPMVWGVCRRVLRSPQDAEDAFQATFLVLVRKAASIVSRELLANWLYGVAHRTALKAKASAAKRQRKERPMAEMPEPEVAPQDRRHDLLPLLDQALSNLPDKYRVAIVLCDLEGKTRKEAARQLGCPEGTVAGRLARARTMLAKRLARHGVEISGASLAMVLAEVPTSAGVPTSVVSSTIEAATLIAVGQAATTGMVSAKVAALTESVLKAMLLAKLRTTTLVLMVLGMAAFGGGLLTQQMAAGQQGQAEKSSAEDKKGDADAAKKETPIPKTSEEKSSMAWGKPKDGVRIGILHARAGPGGKGGVQLSVVLENVGKDDVVMNLGIMLANGKKQFPTAIRLTLIDAANKKHVLHLPQPGVAGRVDPFVVPLPAGCRYTLPCALNKYVDADPANLGVPLKPGLYRAAAEFVGKGVAKEGTNRDMTGLALMNYWTGTVASGEAPVTVPAKPSGGQEEEADKKELEKLQGTWIGIGGEFRSKEGSEEESRKAGHKLVISGDKFTWGTALHEDGNEVGLMKGTIAIDPTKRPKIMDMSFDRDGKPAIGKCIYELDGDTLKLCYGEPVRPTKFKTTTDSDMPRLYIWERKKN
jgi:RNA polymerase sigma factor (sigma-70 family)